jgi:hypothetical protein
MRTFILSWVTAYSPMQIEILAQCSCVQHAPETYLIIEVLISTVSDKTIEQVRVTATTKGLTKLTELGAMWRKAG